MLGGAEVAAVNSSKFRGDASRARRRVGDAAERERGREVGERESRGPRRARARRGVGGTLR